MPPAIGRLTRLGRLDLHSNDIAALPDELGALTGVRRCVSGRLADGAKSKVRGWQGARPPVRQQARAALGSTRTERRPPLPHTHPQVRHLSLHFNALTSLPPGIGGCTSLVWCVARRVRAARAAQGRSAPTQTLGLLLQTSPAVARPLAP